MVTIDQDPICVHSDETKLLLNSYKEYADNTMC